MCLGFEIDEDAGATNYIKSFRKQNAIAQQLESCRFRRKGNTIEIYLNGVLDVSGSSAGTATSTIPHPCSYRRRRSLCSIIFFRPARRRPVYNYPLTQPDQNVYNETPPSASSWPEKNDRAQGPPSPNEQGCGIVDVCCPADEPLTSNTPLR